MRTTIMTTKGQDRIRLRNTFDFRDYSNVIHNYTTNEPKTQGGMHGVLHMQQVDARGDVLHLRATPRTV